MGIGRVRSSLVDIWQRRGRGRVGLSNSRSQVFGCDRPNLLFYKAEFNNSVDCTHVSVTLYQRTVVIFLWKYNLIKYKQGPAGQRWVLGHIKHIQHIKHIKHFQQCQSWTAPMIFMKEIVYFLAFKKNRLPTIRRTDGPTDGRTHPHIEMGGPI